MYKKEVINTEDKCRVYARDFFKQVLGVEDKDIIDLPTYKGFDDTTKDEFILDKTVQWWQTSHVDIIILWKGIRLYVDVKGVNDNWDSFVLTYEILKKYEDEGYEVRDGWIELNEDLPFKYQLVLHINKDYACITYKTDFIEFMERNINIERIKWTKDKGSVSRNKYAKNYYLAYRDNNIDKLKDINVRLYKKESPTNWQLVRL